MDINLFFSARLPKQIGGVTIDAFMREGHQRAAKVTEYPVEDGATISDNIILQPDTLQLEGAVGPTEVVDLTGVASVTNRILDTKQALDALHEARAPITVVTGLKVYENMVIKEFNIDRDATTGQSLPFTMTLQRLQIVTSQTAMIPNAKVEGDQAAGSVDVGKASVKKKEEPDWFAMGAKDGTAAYTRVTGAFAGQ